MLPFPAIDPVALSVGPLQIRWYGISYIVGFFLSTLYATKVLFKRPPVLFKNEKQFIDLAVNGLMAAIVGGRIGHIILYTPEKFSHILYIWEGGMSFHGAFIGALIYGIYSSRKLNIPFLYIADFFATFTPIGLFFGRIGNFINGELFGRSTDVSWAMIFPSDPLPRHPSQLYEAFLEGFLLFVILGIYHRQKSIREKHGLIFCMFIGFYGLFRSFCEVFRDPDFALNLSGFEITSGQLYSTPMILGGLILGTILWRQKKPSPF